MKKYEKRHSLSKIKLPPSEQVGAEEIERRRQVVARILERRRRIGPIGARVTDLVRAVREEAEGD